MPVMRAAISITCHFRPLSRKMRHVRLILQHTIPSSHVCRLGRHYRSFNIYISVHLTAACSMHPENWCVRNDSNWPLFFSPLLKWPNKRRKDQYLPLKPFTITQKQVKLHIAWNPLLRILPSNKCSRAGIQCWTNWVRCKLCEEASAPREFDSLAAEI